MAGNPKRIPKVIEELQKTWELVPDWRLGQLVSNANREFAHREYGNPEDPFYLEDSALVTGLKLIRHQHVDKG